MKRTKKNAFTIAEILLVLAIIGIISAMGATITKKTSAKAYNYFWQNGYVSLNDVISDIEYNNSTTDGSGNIVYKTFNKDKWVSEVNKVFNGHFEDGDDGKDVEAVETIDSTVKTNNGTTYKFETDASNNIVITMTVPAPKTRTNNGKATAKLLFDLNNSNMLIPISGGDVDLSKRMDLLPVMIDDGQKGRIIQKYDGGDAKYKGSNTYTFQEAYCRNKGKGNGSYLSCTDADGKNLVPANLEIGILTFPSLKH